MIGVMSFISDNFTKSSENRVSARPQSFQPEETIVNNLKILKEELKPVVSQQKQMSKSLSSIQSTDRYSLIYTFR